MTDQKKQRSHVQTFVGADAGGTFVQWFDVDTDEVARWYAGRASSDPRGEAQQRILQGPPSDGWIPLSPSDGPEYVVPALDLGTCTLDEAQAWVWTAVGFLDELALRASDAARAAGKEGQKTHDLAFVLRESCLAELEVVLQSVRFRDTAHGNTVLATMAIRDGAHSCEVVARRVAALRIVVAHGWAP